MLAPPIRCTFISFMWPAVAGAPSAGAAGPPAGAGHAAGAMPGAAGVVCVVARGPPSGAGVLGRAWKTARRLAKVVVGAPLGVPRPVPGPLSTGPLVCTSNRWAPLAAKEGGSGGGPATVWAALFGSLHLCYNICCKRGNICCKRAKQVAS